MAEIYDNTSAADNVKKAIRAATKIATDALRETPSMTEITVEYQGVKITLRREQKDEDEDFDGM